jgi:hypothetical protein
MKYSAKIAEAVLPRDNEMGQRAGRYNYNLD